MHNNDYWQRPTSQLIRNIIHMIASFTRFKRRRKMLVIIGDIRIVGAAASQTMVRHKGAAVGRLVAMAGAKTAHCRAQQCAPAPAGERIKLM